MSQEISKDIRIRIIRNNTEIIDRTSIHRFASINSDATIFIINLAYDITKIITDTFIGKESADNRRNDIMSFSGLSKKAQTRDGGTTFKYVKNHNSIKTLFIDESVTSLYIGHNCRTIQFFVEQKRTNIRLLSGKIREHLDPRTITNKYLECRSKCYRENIKRRHGRFDRRNMNNRLNARFIATTAICTFSSYAIHIGTDNNKRNPVEFIFITTRSIIIAGAQFNGSPKLNMRRDAMRRIFFNIILDLKYVLSNTEYILGFGIQIRNSYN